jgi:Uncharacterized protein conserved in bacteria
MKVTNVSQVPSGMQNVSAPGSAQLDTGAGFSFSRHMSDFSDAQYQKYLEGLRDRIFSQGEVIKRKADISEFLQYRKLIAELLGEAASNAFACGRTHAFDSKGRRNVFVTIKKVNARLDEMAQEILSEQSDNIALLEMVDDIRGLLVDIFL